MKFIKYFSILSAVAALCGCATTSVNTEFAPGVKADGKEPLAVVAAENYGYYLFGYFPIFAGDPDLQNDASMCVFEDTVTIENNHAMLERELKKLNAGSMTDVRDSTFWTGGFSLWIVWRQTLKTNALALSPEPSRDSK